ncbi:SpoIIIAH-like protein [uncultured Clostridium sp.]|uniref:SpoIIIAH-like family protein n=1 Tax=uncultured Clostridium sp. TaxID=59620 RepID=UPI000822A024|nr:SpoIIIAH-like family protein [uncultured Clostridium sp.]SCK04271.1 SpoIIIAH-like protein [uncultured Clostridium sp.]
MGENKIICPDCGKENKKGNILCIGCGKVLQSDLAQARIDKTYPKYDLKKIKTNLRSKVKNRQLSIIVGAILCISIIGTVIYATGKSTNDNTGGLTADLSALLLENDNAEETMSNQGFFYNDRANKIKSDTEFKEEMTAIIEDTTSSQEVIDNATNLLNAKIQKQEQEIAVETEIMNNGYEDALCMINTDKVTVYVKTSDTFTMESSVAIQNIVEGITGLTDIQIESKR